MIALTLVLRVNEPLAATLVSSFANETNKHASAIGGVTVGTALPWMRATIVARPGATFGGYVATYLVMQMLSVPGCAALNAAAGATLGVGLALPL